MLTLGSPTGTGVFFPNGLNGVIKTPAGFNLQDPGTASFNKAVPSGQVCQHPAVKVFAGLNCGASVVPLSGAGYQILSGSQIDIDLRQSLGHCYRIGPCSLTCIARRSALRHLGLKASCLDPPCASLQQSGIHA